MKVVINRCYGGYSISLLALQWLIANGHAGAKQELEEFEAELAKMSEKERKKYQDQRLGYNSWGRYIERNDPLLVACVQALGSEKASGQFAEVKIVEIPDGIAWEIDDYDGMESVQEQHQSWS